MISDDYDDGRTPRIYKTFETMRDMLDEWRGPVLSDEGTDDARVRNVAWGRAALASEQDAYLAAGGPELGLTDADVRAAVEAAATGEARGGWVGAGWYELEEDGARVDERSFKPYAVGAGALATAGGGAGSLAPMGRADAPPPVAADVPHQPGGKRARRQK
jgi:hypothetical protein